jgi:GR25 family glycosyltransferase involved in LPS biosynthesis
MKKRINVFVLTIKNSHREHIIRKRLNFLKINHKFFYAIDGRSPNNFKILYNKYNKKKCLNILGRDMTYPEISNAEGHLRIYKYIVKKKILNAVIMEDDCYPSKTLCDWLNLEYFFCKKEYDIIQIYHSSGLVYKKPLEVILNKFYLYKTCFTLPYTTCYQITKKACKYILNRNKKISRLADWPVNFYDGKLKQFIVLPRLTSLHFNHLNTSHNTEVWKKFVKMEKIKKFVPFYNIMTALYFLLHIPLLLREYKDYSYYKEKYLLPKIFFIKDLLSNKYINLKNISKNKMFY